MILLFSQVSQVDREGHPAGKKTIRLNVMMPELKAAHAMCRRSSAPVNSGTSSSAFSHIGVGA